jgi:arginine/lysine/ornithine decarboxylase
MMWIHSIKHKCPFLSFLKEQTSRHTSFHMSGHKGTKEPRPMLLDYFVGDLHVADLVEIIRSVDYSHSPKGSLSTAQIWKKRPLS